MHNIYNTVNLKNKCAGFLKSDGNVEEQKEGWFQVVYEFNRVLLQAQCKAFTWCIDIYIYICSR